MFQGLARISDVGSTLALRGAACGHRICRHQMGAPGVSWKKPCGALWGSGRAARRGAS